jgi:hypothetical protein
MHAGLSIGGHASSRLPRCREKYACHVSSWACQGEQQVNDLRVRRGLVTPIRMLIGRNTGSTHDDHLPRCCSVRLMFSSQRLRGHICCLPSAP